MRSVVVYVNTSSALYFLFPEGIGVFALGEVFVGVGFLAGYCFDFYVFAPAVEPGVAHGAVEPGLPTGAVLWPASWWSLPWPACA